MEFQVTNEVGSYVISSLIDSVTDLLFYSHILFANTNITNLKSKLYFLNELFF